MFKPVIIPAEKLAKRQQNAVMLAGIALAWLFYPFIGMFTLLWIKDTLVKLYVSRFLIWGTLPVISYYATRVEGRPLLLWPEKRWPVGFYIIAPIVLFILFFAAGALAAIPRFLGYHDDLTVFNQVLKLMQPRPLFCIFVAFTAGVIEEFSFRGYILPRLTGMMNNRVWPIIISSVMFASLHFSYKSLTEILFSFFFGIIAAIFYQQYRSLGTIIVCHFLYDTIVVLLHK